MAGLSPVTTEPRHVPLRGHGADNVGTVTVLPHDRHQCSGCGQLLIFGADGFVAKDQLAQCLGRCVWTLVERNGVIVETVPPQNR